MQRLEVSGAVRLIYKSLGVKGLMVRKVYFPIRLCASKFNNTKYDNIYVRCMYSIRDLLLVER